MDVISHLPVLCEDHSIPYIFVTSRAELGSAGNTKRPTSVVLIARNAGKKSKKEKVKKEDPDSKKGEPDPDKREVEEKEENWDDIFGELLKVVEKASQVVKI